MNGFAQIRRGLLEHIQEGKLCPSDLGTYTFLQLIVRWETGICFTCAAGIASQFNDPLLKKQVQKSLHRLRERGYINYRSGSGQRGSYSILIHKYEVMVGGLSGMRLNAFADGSLDKPVYEPWGGGETVERQWGGSGAAVEGPILEVKEEQHTKTPRKNCTPPTRTRFQPPTLEEIVAYCQERGNKVNPQKWFDHYTSNGWKVGCNPMKDWRAAVRKWEDDGGSNHGSRNGSNGRQASLLAARNQAQARLVDSRPADLAS